MSIVDKRFHNFISDMTPNLDGQGNPSEKFKTKHLFDSKYIDRVSPSLEKETIFFQPLSQCTKSFPQKTKICVMLGFTGQCLLS